MGARQGEQLRVAGLRLRLRVRAGPDLRLWPTSSRPSTRALAWFGPGRRQPRIGLLDQAHRGRVDGATPRAPARTAVEVVRATVKGFAAGYNAYLRKTGRAKPPDPTRRGKGWVRLITETHDSRALTTSSACAPARANFLGEIVAAKPPAAGAVAATTGSGQLQARSAKRSTRPRSARTLTASAATARAASARSCSATRTSRGRARSAGTSCTWTIPGQARRDRSGAAGRPCGEHRLQLWGGNGTACGFYRFSPVHAVRAGSARQWKPTRYRAERPRLREHARQHDGARPRARRHAAPHVLRDASGSSVLLFALLWA